MSSQLEVAVSEEASVSSAAMSYREKKKPGWLAPNPKETEISSSSSGEQAKASTGAKASAKFATKENTIHRGNSVIKFLVLKKLPDATACADPGMGMDGDMWMELH